MYRLLLPILIFTHAAGIAHAQQTVLGAEQRQQIEGILSKWVDAFNKEDWNSQFAWYTNKSPVIGPLGIWHGKQEAIQGSQQGYSNKGGKLSATIDRIEPLDTNTVLCTASYAVTFRNAPEAKGALMFIFQNDGGSWTILGSSASRHVPLQPN